MLAAIVNQILQGVLLGGLYAMFAMGLSLSVGILRFVNIAHGDLIVAASFLLLTLTSQLGLPPFLAVLLVIPVAFGGGYLLQRLLFQRALGKSVLPIILVTFGLSIIIQNGLLGAYGADTRKVAGGAFETATLALGDGVNIGVLPLTIFLTAVAMIGFLDRLLYATRIGARIRAVSDDVATADLVGLRSARIYAIAMGVVGVTIAISAGFMSIWTNFDPTSGPSRLITAFEAVVLGGLGSLWGTLAGGIVLGVAQSLGAQVDAAWQVLAGHLVFLTVFLIRPQGLFPPLLRPAMFEPKAFWTVALGRGVLALGAAVLIVGPTLFSIPQLQLLTQFLSLLVIAIMWNLLAGYADIVSIGQHAFVGIGAYAFYGFAVFAGLNPFIALVMAGATTLLFALPVMLIIFRLREAYLAVGSWVVAETLMLIAGKLSAFGGGSGVSMPVSVVKELGAQPTLRYETIYWLSFALAGLALASTFVLMRSRVGIGLTAMRDDEEGAGAIGVNLIRSRILCFLWAAPFLGIAGGIITLQKLRVAPPASFSITDWTVYVIFIVVIGGIGSFEGPIIGTIVFFLIRQYLADIGVWHFILLGVLSIAVILIEPRGLWGLLRRIIPQDLIPVSHAPPRRRRTQTPDADKAPAPTL